MAGMAVAVHPRVWFERRRARREADYWIVHGFERRYPVRVAELTSRHELETYARSLRNVRRELTGRLASAAPLRRAALQPHEDLLEAIELRLLDGEPISGLGMLAVHDLLGDADSCVYSPVEDVESELRDALAKLGVD